jgi:hypothetical protein
LSSEFVAMSSEWMKVMLEEIARKKAEGEQALAERVRREAEGQREGHLHRVPTDREDDSAE